MYYKAESLKSSSESLSGRIQMQEHTVFTFEKHGSVVGTTKTGATSQKRGKRQKNTQNDDCRKP